MPHVAGRKAALFASACLCMLFALPAAAGALSVTPVPDYAAGKIAVHVEYDVPATHVRLTVGGVLRDNVAVTAESRSVTTTQVALSQATAFFIEGIDAVGQVWTAEVVVDPAKYRPRTPLIPNLPRGRVCSSLIDVASQNSVPFTRVKARLDSWDPWKTYSLGSPATRHMAWDLRAPRGPVTVQVVHSNGFGSSPIGTTTVYWIGSVPTTTRSLVVDKQYLAAFHVYNRKVVKWWPVAVGKLNTPTPNGDFKLGAAQPAGGAWGVLRRRLYRLTGVGTMYYIHGTNEPWSIGSYASHGCVRMYNTHIVQVTQTVPVGTRVRIH